MNFKKALSSTGAALILGTTMVPAFADSVFVNFEPTAYVVGDINGQNGWIKTGNFDVAVVPNIYGHTTFGTQSLRTSDEFTTNAFGDQTFAPPLTNSVGEAGSTNGTFSPGAKQRHFETQFDFASTMLTEQAGMHVSISPDRGDGSRMSYLRFDDTATGIDVFFDDVQQPTSCATLGCTANFVETQIGTITRNVPHTIKLTMDLLDGPGNDVVKVYIDGTLVQTGTSWEDYYRYDPEASAEQTPRIIKTVLFRESAAAHAANAGKGFLIDNFSTFSGPILVGPPTNKDQCKKDGWKTFNNPTFKNQGECVSFVEHLIENGHNQGHDQCDSSVEHLNKQEHNHDHD